MKARPSFTLNDLYWVLGEQEFGCYEFRFSKALEKNGRNVNYINIHAMHSKTWSTLDRYSHRLPRKYDNAVQRKYFTVINDALITKYRMEKPSYIFVYNGCKLLPESVEFFKNNGTRLIIFLGDDPNYLFPAMKTFLLTVLHSDAVIVPDTGWIDGLKFLNIKNVIYSPVGTAEDTFFPFLPEIHQSEKYETDILFVGTGYYLNSWGIRRAAILNELSGMSFKLFGDNQWLELFPYFPKLKAHFINEPLSASEVNTACNCSKIYPVLINHGVVNGAPTRVFDCIASGIFVIAEYRRDLDMLFQDEELVTFKSKNELRNKAKYFLKNDGEMKDYISRARKTVHEKYRLDLLVKNILEQI